MTDPRSRSNIHVGVKRNAPDLNPDSLHHDGSFGKYMQVKNRKLHEQFEEMAAAAGGGTGGVFAGVNVFVNGFTVPSQLELKQIMAENGGRFENYYCRAVTHIVCTNLPDSKVKHHAHERNPPPTVRPEWVVDSLAAGRLLPVTDYALWRLRDAPGQRTLAAFAAQPLSRSAPDRPAAPAHLPAWSPAGGKGQRDQSAIPDPLAARAAKDILKGPPRSSRDDPAFQATFWQASRLHFIGSWKARIEVLAAKLAGDAPAPKPPGRGGQRVIVHIDMDCFFASVAVLGNPELAGKPLAISHSASARGAGEVSSASYEARAFGVRAGMFMEAAKALCPGLVVMPYEFEQYEAISEQVYRLMLQRTSCVQPLSCDEAFMDVTGLGDPEALVSALRADIAAATGCTASAGVGPSLLLARLATRRAKPNGQLLVTAREADALLLGLAAGDLPGVGPATRERLDALGIKSVADARARTKAALQRELGGKTGASLWDYAHGRDTREVEPSGMRKTVGCEINYGVRFDGQADADRFVDELAVQLAERLAAAGARGRTLTLKLKRRKAGAPEPRKFLGHGICDNLSRSVTLPRFTDSAKELGREGRALLRAVGVPARDIRGVGLTMAKLDSDPASGAARPTNAKPAKLAAPPPSAYNPREPHPWNDWLAQKMAEERCADAAAAAAVAAAAEPSPGAAAATPVGRAALPSLSEIDAAVWAELPESVQRDLLLQRQLAHPRSPARAAVGLRRSPLRQAGGLAIGPGAGGSRAGTGSRAGVVDADAEGRAAAGTPILALPPASQLEPGVLDALPLSVRRELERAYGIGVGFRAMPFKSPPKRRRGGGGSIGDPGDDARERRLDELGMAAGEFGASLVPGDLEGAQLLLRRLAGARMRWPRFAARASAAAQRVQAAARRELGAPLALTGRLD
ncbi:hypothetical protein WJX81_003182 [Elliptochloris bilobata]|uniref:DNA repair protein REV1 n=1 Tax=Elliptochloris bilobata TaxID=381761 RepID=A0AAW1SER1_9CHLO